MLLRCGGIQGQILCQVFLVCSVNCLPQPQQYQFVALTAQPFGKGTDACQPGLARTLPLQQSYGDGFVSSSLKCTVNHFS